MQAVDVSVPNMHQSAEKNLPRIDKEGVSSMSLWKYFSMIKTLALPSVARCVADKDDIAFYGKSMQVLLSQAELQV